MCVRYSKGDKVDKVAAAHSQVVQLPVGSISVAGGGTFACIDEKLSRLSSGR